MENLDSDPNADAKSQRHLTQKGKIILGVCGAAFVGIYAVAGPFVTPALRKICLPFVPATPRQVDNVFTALSRRRGSLLDIGSGDGRIVLEASKRGYRASGVELNIWLILYSRYQAWKQKCTKAEFYRKDLWNLKLSEYENIVVFGVEQMMEPLEKKFAKELSAECHVVACRFQLPNWEPVRVVGKGVDTVWLYRVATSQAKEAKT